MLTTMLVRVKTSSINDKAADLILVFPFKSLFREVLQTHLYKAG
jgi:hypothetical protein